MKHPRKGSKKEFQVAKKPLQSDRLLVRECAKLDPNEERQLAEEGLALELDQWPKY
jgi:hypothetical protein